MANNNTVILIGNLGDDPKAYQTEEGKPFLVFNLATQDSYLAEEEWKTKETLWHTIMVFRPRAIEYAQKFKKGDRVQIKGLLSYKEFKDAEGYPHQECSIICRHIEAAELTKADTDQATDIHQGDSEVADSEEKELEAASW